MANKSMLALAGGVIGLLAVGGLVWVSLQWLGGSSASDPVETTGRPPRERGGAERADPLVPLDPAEGTAAPAPRVEPAEPEPVGEEVTLRFEGYEQALDRVNWPAVATALFHLARDLPQVAFGVQRDDVPPEVSDRVHARSVELDRTLIEYRGSFPGVGAIGVLTHPAFYPNALAATLEAAGRPLSTEQKTALRALAEATIPKDEARVTALSSGAIAVEQMVSEVELRADFVDRARGLLDARQRLAVGAGPFENRVGLDPLSPSMQWQGHVIPMPVDERDMCLHTIFGDVAVPLLEPDDEESHDEAMAFLLGWWDRVPMPPPARTGKLTIAGHPEQARALAGARFTAQLVQAMLTTFKVRDERFRLGQVRRQILVPVRMRGR